MIYNAKEGFNLEYVITNNNACIMGITPNSWSGTLKIPSYINGYPVKGISNIECSAEIILLPETLTFIEARCFEGNKNLAEIHFPDGLKFIGDKAFKDCISLTSVSFGDNIETIGSSAFAGCKKLNTITLPDKLINIHPQAFMNTKYVKSDSNWTDDILCIGNHLIRCRQNLTGTLVIPKNVINIAFSAFRNSKIDECVLHNKITVIPDSAFNNCNLLSKITFSSNLKEIHFAAFAKCCSLNEITIPESIELISDFAFEKCKNLKILSLPNKPICMGSYILDDTPIFKEIAKQKEQCVGNHLIWIEISKTSKEEIKQYSIRPGVVSIKNWAVPPEIECIQIPNSVQFMDKYSIPTKTTIIASDKSYAARWAKMNGRSLITKESKVQIFLNNL